MTRLLYRKYSEYLKEKYGEKVYKIPVNLPLTCPNRDGTLGTGGCAFCAEEAAGFESLPSEMAVKDQIERNIAYIGKKYGSRKFIVYFQNFSNTYLPLSKFRWVLEQIPRREDIVGVDISTRPDLIREDYLDAAKKCGWEVTWELGLQTVNYKTLRKIGRGHTLAEFLDAVRRIQTAGMKVCAHVILNLPGDDMQDVIECAKILSAMEVSFVKLHSLYIMEGTRLADWYRSGQFTPISREEYIGRVGVFLQYLNPKIVVERLIARAPKEGSLFVNWGVGSYKLVEQIEKTLLEQGIYQGQKYGYLGGRTLEKFD